MASPVRLLHRVQVVLALLHFVISVFLEVSVNSFLVTPFLMAIQAVTGLLVLVRPPVTGFVTGLRVLVHSYSHFVLWLDTIKFHRPAITMKETYVRWSMKNESIKPWTTRNTKFRIILIFLPFSWDVVFDLRCSVRGLRRDSRNKTLAS